MHVKNHMAMWSLWFLWFLRVEYSGNQLYKPLCAFLVFVDLVWFLCGSCVGRFVVFGSIVVFGSGLRVLLLFVVFVARWSCSPTWQGDLWFFSDRWSCPHRCASTCSLWTAKKICPLSYFVLCSVSSSLETTFTNGENDHG